MPEEMRETVQIMLHMRARVLDLVASGTSGTPDERKSYADQLRNLFDDMLVNDITPD